MYVTVFIENVGGKFTSGLSLDRSIYNIWLAHEKIITIKYLFLKTTSS